MRREGDSDNEFINWKSSEQVGRSLDAMSRLFESERQTLKSAWDRERSDLLRMLEMQRTESERTMMTDFI